MASLEMKMTSERDRNGPKWAILLGWKILDGGIERMEGKEEKEREGEGARPPIIITKIIQTL